MFNKTTNGIKSSCSHISTLGKNILFHRELHTCIFGESFFLLEEVLYIIIHFRMFSWDERRVFLKFLLLRNEIKYPPPWKFSDHNASIIRIVFKSLFFFYYLGTCMSPAEPSDDQNFLKIIHNPAAAYIQEI